MSLYNKAFYKIDINLDEIERINKYMVTNSYIYKYRDMIIKKYWYCTEYAIGDNMFNKLCSIDNKHLIKLYELYTILSDYEYDYYKQRNLFSKDGYTAKYYKKDSINPVLESSNYLIENIEGIKELIEILSSYKIIMKDTKIGNSIIQNSGIVLIDPDYYEFSNLDIESIRKNNYKELLCLIKTIFEHYSKKGKKYFSDLENNDPIDSINYIENNLKKVIRPIDMVSKNRY